LISDRALNELKKNREALTDELIEQIKREYPLEIPPARETVLKLISEARNHGTSPQDAPWHLGLLDNPSPLLDKHLFAAEVFTAEAIGHIIRVKEWATKDKDTLPVTIRIAKWISRLYSLIEDDKKRWSKPLERSFWKVAFIYASYELLCEISLTSFNTSEMDGHLSKGESDFMRAVVWKQPDLKHYSEFLKSGGQETLVEKAISATMYQYGGLGSARHYLEYLESKDNGGEQ
jgi:hypothetical protein